MQTPNIKAVIDLGSVSVRMEVVQIDATGTIQPLDSLSQSVQLGRDTFTDGRIKRNSIEQCVKIFRSFTSVLHEYRLDLEQDVTAVATSAVREARNCDTFLERLYVASGIWVQAIDGATVNRLTFLGVWPLIRSKTKILQKSINIWEIGGGSTEILGLKNGQIRFSHSYRFGSYRFREKIIGLNLSKSAEKTMAESEIDAVLRSFDNEIYNTEKPRLILMGSEIRFAAKRLRPKWNGTTLMTANVSSLSKMADEFFFLNAEEIASRHNLPLEEAQILGFTLLAYTRIAQRLSLKQVYLCGVSLRSGLLARGTDKNRWYEEFNRQVLSSARQLAAKYHSDIKHAECVEALSIRLFNEMQPEHKLTPEHALLLRVAALLHDCGRFVSLSAHHKHSQYLIENSDLFGLSKDDIKMAGLLARYHRKTEPKPSHPDYNALSRNKKMVVTKLAAILRVADALDNSHNQEASHYRFFRNEDQLCFMIRRPGELNAARLALKEKARLFEQIFGLNIVPMTQAQRK
jgi:exopolyphosphatase/guanosine-5'-triphosphate,3'-diphosphate pyrophosphatase